MTSISPTKQIFPSRYPASLSDETDLVSVEGLTVEYMSRDSDTVYAVRNVSLSIRRGETFALVGESGSGKSSVGLALLDYLPRGARRRAKHMRIGGIDFIAESKEALHRLRGKTIAAVYQNPRAALNPAMTVGRQLAEILEHHMGFSRTKAAAKAQSLLDEVRIRNPAAIMTRFPHQLSGGMQQRVCIAMAIALEPALIILDEPTTALDATVQRQIMDLLVDLQQRLGTSYLLISHDIKLVRAYAHRAAVMKDGEILETISAPRLDREATHPYTLQLLHSAGGSSTTFSSNVTSTKHVAFAVRDVEHRFSHPDAPGSVVRGISFDIGAGETLGLVGESGSGKSTIGNIICGVYDIQRGAIAVGEKYLPVRSNDRTKADRNMIRMVFQSPDATLNPRHSVYAILHRAATISRAIDPAARVVELLDQVQIPQRLAERRPSELSGGQKQRVAIARAFASKPRLIVLDEPTSALDATVQVEILRLLQELQSSEKVSYLLITHDLDVVEKLADRLMVIQNGAIVEQGATRQVMQEPKSAYTRQLVSSRFY
jgi:peptide/nickel transport system ATP-binding protein